MASGTPYLWLPSHLHSTASWPVLISHLTEVRRLSLPECLFMHPDNVPATCFYINWARRRVALLT